MIDLGPQSGDETIGISRGKMILSHATDAEIIQELVRPTTNSVELLRLTERTALARILNHQQYPKR